MDESFNVKRFKSKRLSIVLHLELKPHCTLVSRLWDSRYQTSLRLIWELGNFIYVSISKYGSDTPVTRPETDKAGLSSRDRKRGGGKLKCY